ncbi:pilus assembly protein PilY [Psychrobacter sp. JCM 18903]|uniref:pilus assembly protein PilY n=1 Tax=Psychrobacter sp. JCM 18903 TaxID=1298610 RepID=UPI00191AB31E|nr:pilus assembly protein PilY [Psychrobacter sp. JCM 18903]
MKRLNNVSPAQDSKVLPLKYLVVVMASMMVMPVAQADVAGKRIGDLEIYKAAEGGKTTITMMLDTSGSMAANFTKGACDLPSGVSNNQVSINTQTSTTTPSYTKRYCEVNNSKRYYYRLSPEGQWYRCGPSDGSGDSSYNYTSICVTAVANPSLGSEYSFVTSGSDNKYYYTSTKYYDRLTRLKDALFTLMDNTLLDPKKVAIGIGQFSSQSGSDNLVSFNESNGLASDADSKTGKILVPAALVDYDQRAKIKAVVAAAGGGGNTPTANAYAEVGAYMLGKNTSASTYSGYDKSVSTSKSGGSYNSPLSSPSSCDGRGIYFLTDGEPNSSPNPNYVMQLALGASSFSIPSVTLPNGTQNNNGMPQVGAFAKALRDPAINPLGTNREIYTAVVGFGSVFDVDASDIVNLPYTNPKTGITANRDFYNCANISNIDARNACNWGEKAHPDLPGVGGFGEGGFYSAQSTEDIVKSITSFVSGLNQNLPSTPSGTIIIPDDPYRADSQLAVAYYPTLQADVKGNAVIWDGNMKKYLLNEGTLYGSNDNKLFKNVAGELEPTTPDLWSDKDYSGANNDVKSGGFYALLNTPKTGVTSTRTLYVEDLNGTTPVLRKFGVNDSGKVVVDNAALTTTSFSDTATFDEITLRRLLNFLGFDNLPSTAVKDMTLTTDNATVPIRVVGATIHSTPAAVSYAATLDEDGKVTATRDDYVLFGSSEGGLHLVDADNYSAGGDGGKEDFVVIPREILRDKSKSLALVDDANKAEIGSPNFGIDAPWLVSADYKYDLDNNTVNIATDGNKGLYAYGGLRMGGEAFYGLNLTTRTSPSMMFTITPTSTGFERMGQIWSKPTKAKIKRTSTDTGTDVLVFGGGYDMCYEYEKFQVGVTDTDLGACSGIDNVQGNAVYIINAQDGSLIWSAAGTGTASTTVNTMTNSVVAGITTLDRDNDGFMDHIYFADLGGQLFRADFTNAGFKTPSAIGSTPTGTPTTTTAFANTRVTRILSGAYTGTDTKFNHRFYERPVVSFHRNSQSNNLFALVNVISGDRSSPLSKIRDLSKSDRLYGIMDTDVTKADNFFYASNFTSTAAAAGGQSISNLSANNTDASNLVELPGKIGTLGATGYTLEQKNVVSELMRQGTKQGWYYPLTRFDGYGNVRYTKGIGKSQVIDSFLYTTAYNPDMSYGSTNTCSAKIVGGSERQLYCLPYGICTDANSKNGTGGFVRAGQGLQELTLGPRSSTLSNQRLLIGTRTLAERATDRVDFGTDTGKDVYTPINEAQGLGSADQILGSGSAPELIFNERYTLQPKTWYEVD